MSGSPLASRETSPHRVCNASRHITSSLETSPASSHSASPLPPDTDGEEEEFIDTVETAPERSQKDNAKSSSGVQKNAADKTGELTINENVPKLTNSYTNVNGHVDGLPEIKQERGRQRVKKDDKSQLNNAEFFNQIAATMTNLQRDLDRITARVRSLEGQALQALTPQTTQTMARAYRKWWPFPECSPRLLTLIVAWPFVAHFLISLTQRYRQRRL